MLIEMDDSLLPSRNLAPSQKFWFSINKILETRYYGNHFAIASRELISELQSSEHIEKKAKAVLQKMSANYSTENAQARKISRKIIVTNSHTIEKSGEIWHLPILFFDEHQYLSNKTTLLCENLTDSYLYYHAAHHHRIKNRLGLSTSLDYDCGGGSQIGRKVENLSTSGRVFVCIVDSDRKCPDCARGQTAIACEKSFKSNKLPAELITTDCRELENLIPKKLLESTLENDKLTSFEVFSNLFSDFYNYLDIKKGTNLFWIMSHAEHSPEKQFWRPAVDKFKAKCHKNRCAESNECIQNDRDQCQCILFSGLGEKVAEQILDTLEKNSPQKSAELCPTDNTEWLKIGKAVYEWCCATDRVRL